MNALEMIDQALDLSRHRGTIGVQEFQNTLLDIRLALTNEWTNEGGSDGELPQEPDALAGVGVSTG